MSLTYGCIVRQIMEDCEEEPNSANEILKQMGTNIGNRLIDEYLAKTETGACKNFKDVGVKLISAFKMFFGIEAKLNMKNNQEFTILFNENPLAENVVVPDKYKGLAYSNLICGIIKGALDAVNMRVKVYFIRDCIGNVNQVGEPNFEIKVELEELIKRKLKDYDD